jgi:saccharopine dehydrogenase-like NADP-dependent oxidoreductase
LKSFKREGSKMKVLVLGCGEMGETTIEDLYYYSKFDEIIVGTRSLDKIKMLMSKLSGRKAKISPRKIDVNNKEDLEALMKGCTVAVNCIGPNYKYEVPIAQTAIKTGVNLVDINDEYETTFRMLNLDTEAKDKSITIVLGLGASPGINNILVRAAADQLDEIEEIHTAWVMSGADPGGLALSYHLLYSLSGKALTYQNGEFVEV